MKPASTGTSRFFPMLPLYPGLCEELLCFHLCFPRMLCCAQTTGSAARRAPSLLAELRCINTERHDLEPPCQSLYTNRTDLDKDERSSPLDERGRHCCISTASTQKKPNWWGGPSKTWLSQPSLLSCSQLHHSETSWAILSTVRKRSSGDCSMAKYLSGMCEVSSPILLQSLESPKETKK